MRLSELIERETKLIAQLEAKRVEAEHYKRRDGTPYLEYPSGAYAVHMTEVKDAYWRLRQLQAQS